MNKIKSLKSIILNSIIARVILLILVFCLLIYFIFYFNYIIDKKANIKLGNRVIESIDNYIIVNKKLPDERDWETFKKLNFDTTDYFIRPEFNKINDSVYQLIFVIGFDPPYLMWKSDERKWKMDFPSIPDRLLEKK